MAKKVDVSKLNKQLDSLKNINVFIATREGAEIILEKAIELVPVDTGELQESGRVIEQGNGFAVEFGTDHAIPVEFGTSKMAAQPYLRPAIDESKQEILDTISKEIQSEISERING